MALVKFVQGTLAEYTGLQTKDADTLYFITDERRIYKGSVPMTGGIYQAVASYPASGEVNTIYVNTADGSVQYWNGSAYQQMVKPTSTAISGTGDNLHFATTKAIVDYVTKQISDQDLSSVTDRITALETWKGTASGQLTTIEGKLTTIQGTGDGSIAKALADAKAYTDALKNGDVATNKSDIASLKTDKADKSTTYTKGEVDSAITSAVANAHHLKRAIVTSLPAVAEANEDTIYMVKKTTGGAGQQQYDEYMLINGAFEKIGDSAVDLKDYATKTEVETAKQAAIEAAASDATSKANAAKSGAEATAAAALDAYKKENDPKVTANTTAIATINGDGAGSIKKAAADTLQSAKDYADGLAGNYATKAQGAKADTALQQADITSGSANGTIAVKGTDVAVKGLGSAAYAATTAFDAAGKADQALKDAKSYTDTALTWGTI